jgi:broad specificity phosphatase PhoE
VTKVYLVRHAETEPAGNDAALWPLSERGEAQARKLASQSFWAEVKAIISSDEPKALATVSAVALDRKIPLHTHHGLRELGRTPVWLADYEARVLDVFQKPALSIEGWERAADAQARILSTLAELVLKFDGQPFAVVSHGLVLALLLASVNNRMGQVFDMWQQFGFAAVVLMERE